MNIFLIGYSLMICIACMVVPKPSLYMFHAYLRNKFSIVRLLNRPNKNQDSKVTDFLPKNQRLNQLFYFLMQ